MMLKCFYIFIWIGVFKLSFCQRRMGHGHESVSGRNYLVYFVKSPYSKADDNAWICAGSIVTPTQILTAAACLTEMQKIYVIAGYKKYVHGEDIDKDNCTRQLKKKVIKISVPAEYSIDGTVNQPNWLSVDIGVAYVQEPYNFSDTSYRIYCSYQPQSIIINFEKINQLEKSQAIAVGWGGKQVLGPKLTTNEIFLREANTTVIEKRICSNLVPNPESLELVDKYMLCASGDGLIAEGGTTLDPILDDCLSSRRLNLNNGTVTDCLDDFNFRRANINVNNTGNHSSHVDFISRRSTVEPCQNDHGGPLISWIGTQEVLVGVALNAVAKPNFGCAGPRIYVSTAETEKIIKCLLELDESRRKICNDEIGDKKYQINDIDIKWPEDVTFNLSSLLTEQKISSYLRQGNEEQPLHVRPTKDLGNVDEQGNPQQPGEQSLNQMSQKRANSYYMNPPMDQGQGPPNSQYRDTQGQMQQSQMDLQNQPPADAYNQPQMGSFNQPSMDAYNQPPMDPQSQPQADAYNQPQMASYNQPPVESYNQPQIDQQNQPQGEPYGQPQSFNQPQMESFNQQPAEPFNPQPMDSYNQPPMDSYNQPQMEAQNQTPIDLHNQPQDQMFNRPQISQPSFKPQDSYNQPEALKPPQVDSYNQQQTDSFKPAQGDTYNKPQMDSFKQAQSDLYGNQQKSFQQPPTKSASQPKIEPFGQTQGSFKDPKSSFNIPQIETFKPPAASDTYNPLSIISENQPDDGDSFKLPMDEPFKPSPVEPYKQQSPDSSYNKQQPFKPAPVEPYEQPHLRQVDPGHQRIQPFDQMQPGEQQNMQAFGQSQMQGSSQTTDSSQSRTVLRDRYPQDGGPHAEPDPSHGESQTFEQMYSQLHAGGESPLFDKAPVTEQTFEELYKNLHDGSFDGPHDAELESRGEQSFDLKPFDQPTFQQSYNQPMYEQPSFNQPSFDQPTFNQPSFDQQSFDLNKRLDQTMSEQQYDRNPKMSNMPQAAEKQRDEVKVRPQMPLDYPDYVSYNKRRRNT